MSRDGSGTYSRVVTPPANGDVANATDFNSEINDIASEITASLTAAGTKTWTGTQNANGYGIKTLANTKVFTTAGGTTAYTVTTGASFTAYSQIPVLFVKANATNTGSMTINVDSIGALTVKKNGATNLASGDFVQDYVYALGYDGTNLQLLGGALNTLYQPLDATLTALAAVSWASDSPVIQFTAADTVSLTSAPKFTTVELGSGGATDTTLSRSAAGRVAVEGVDVALVGKKAIPVPASAMIANTTNGPSSGTNETSSNKVMYRTLDFDTTTQEGAQFLIPMPSSWNESTVTFQPCWTAASGSGGVVWELRAVALSDDDALDTAFGTGQTSTDTLITAADVHWGPESSAITIAGTPAANDLVIFQIRRNVSDGSDTLGVDAKLIAIRLFITVNDSIDA